MSQPAARPVPVPPPAVTTTDAPHDAILLLSFGGPNQPEDVVPFLKNVTRGRGIPEERLVEVGQHYYGFGGKSPINELNIELQANLKAQFEAVGVELPVYWGNRNWAPYLIDVMRDMHAAGHRKILVITTSAYSGYSSCCQYNADLEGVLEALAPEGLEFELDRTRHLFNHPSFITANADASETAFHALWGTDGGNVASHNVPAAASRLLFVTHSIPTAMNDSSGRAGGAYLREHEAVAAQVATEVSARLGVPVEYELTFCSRSGPPTQPWLEPDVGDRIEELAAAGVTHVVVAPIGFLSDHMEVVYDLDTEAKAAAEEHDVAFQRAATAGTHPAFIAGVVEVALERLQAAAAGASAIERPCATNVPLQNACWPRSGCCGRAIPASAPRMAATVEP